MSDRKYRQSGYQDSSSPSSQKRGPRPPRDPSEGPRGRGFGKPTGTVFRCAVCGAKQVAGNVEVHSTCSKCNTDLHTCTHCTHFDSSLPNECRRPDITYVSSKARGNQCPEFFPKATQEVAKDEPTKPADPKAAFDALFDF